MKSTKVSKPEWLISAVIVVAAAIFGLYRWCGGSLESKSIPSIQAGIDYKSGSVQPIARAKFYLLRTDLERTLLDAGFSHGSDTTFAKHLTSLAAFSRLLEIQVGGRHPIEKDDSFIQYLTALDKRAAGTVTTDFSGNGRFRHVPPGRYYLVGITHTRTGPALWNLEVTLKPGPETVLLDQNNAAELQE